MASSGTPRSRIASAAANTSRVANATCWSSALPPPTTGTLSAKRTLPSALRAARLRTSPSGAASSAPASSSSPSTER